ncbi:MAG: non-heme iron oxygenase ferredoxin subunit [Actinomycetota bacterium]|nr:non-heme iron oxygenase ferredoxin subunit [Actinomycetota bacterium]
MSDWLRACALADLTEGTPHAVELDGTPVCLVRQNGEVFAIENVCSHADVPLSEGEVEGGAIECWLHGSRFDLRTGKPSGPPAVTPVPVYPTKIDSDDVLVALQES